MFYDHLTYHRCFLSNFKLEDTTPVNVNNGESQTQTQGTPFNKLDDQTYNNADIFFNHASTPLQPHYYLYLPVVINYR